MAQKIGSLRADLSLETAAFTRDLKAARKDVRRSSKQMSKDFGSVKGAITNSIKGLKAFGAAALAAASVGGLAILTKRAIDMADSIGKAADKIGLSTTALQELRFAAGQASVSTKTLDMGMQRFSRRVAEAAAGQGELKKTLTELDIPLRDQEGNIRAIDDVLADYADGIKSAESEQEKLRLAFKAFDSEGATLVSIMRDGAEGLEEFRDKGRKLGVVIGEDLVRGAEDASTSLNSITTALNAQLTKALILAAPKVLALSESFLGMSGDASEFKTNVDSATKVLTGFISAGIILKNVFDIAGQVIAFTGKQIYNFLTFSFSDLTGDFDLLSAKIKGDFKDITKAAKLSGSEISAALKPKDGAGAKRVSGTSESPRVKDLKAQLELTKKITTETNKLLDRENAAADVRKAANEKLFNELGLNGKEFFQDQADDLVAQAAAWKQAGVSMDSVNKFLYENLGELSEKAFEKGEKASVFYLDNLQSRSLYLVEIFEKAQAEAVTELEKIGIKANELNQKDIDIDIHLNDMASIGIDNLLNKVRRLKTELQATSSLANINATGQQGGSTSNTTVIINEQLARDDVSTIVTESQREGERG